MPNHLDHSYLPHTHRDLSTPERKIRSRSGRESGKLLEFLPVHTHEKKACAWHPAVEDGKHKGSLLLSVSSVTIARQTPNAHEPVFLPLHLQASAYTSGQSSVPLPFLR